MGNGDTNVCERSEDWKKDFKEGGCKQNLVIGNILGAVGLYEHDFNSIT